MTADSNGVDRNKILNRLLREAEASRALIVVQRERMADLEKQLQLAEAAAGKQSEAYKLILDELWQTRETILHTEKALAASTQQADLLRTDRDHYKRKYKTARKIALGAAAIAAITALFAFH